MSFRGEQIIKGTTYVFEVCGVIYSELKKLRLIQFKNGKQALTELTSNHKTIFKAFNIKIPIPSSL